MQNDVTTLPVWMLLRRPVTTPPSTRSTMPSENISVCTPRSCLLASSGVSACGISPMPICKVAPSRISVATLRAISRQTASGSPAGSSSSGVVAGDERVDVAHVDEAVAVRARHRRVDLGEHDVGGLERAPHHVDRDAEADIAGAVGGRDLDQRDVDLDPAAAEQRRDLGQEDRRVVGLPGAHRVAHVRADEQRVVPEAPGEAWVRVRRHAERQDVQDLALGDGVVLGQGANQRLAARRSPSR